MKRTHIHLAALALLAASLVYPSTLRAQEFGVGADFMSRYVWRGFDFGESFSIQPTLEFSQDAFTIGTWASYSIAADGSGANEHDFYMSFTTGPVSFGLTDYYFPSPPTNTGIPEGAQFFNFEGDGDGAHYLEPFVSFDGTEEFPLSLGVYSFLYNDPEYSTYFEASLPFAVNGTELGLTLGAIGVLDGNDVDGSGFYGTTSDFAFTNISLSAAREIQLTESFALPVGVSFVLNPHSERTFLVFGISL